GNYRLLPQPPWAAVRDLLDLALYVDAPTPTRIESLVRRQRSHGLDRSAAHDWVHRSDEANAALIATTRDRADRVLTRPGGRSGCPHLRAGHPAGYARSAAPR